MKAVLADHEGCPAGGAICRHGLNSMESVCGYIADVGSRTLHVRRGLGCTGCWTAYTLP